MLLSTFNYYYYCKLAFVLVCNLSALNLSGLLSLPSFRFFSCFLTMQWGCLLEGSLGRVLLVSGWGLKEYNSNTKLARICSPVLSSFSFAPPIFCLCFLFSSLRTGEYPLLQSFQQTGSVVYSHRRCCFCKNPFPVFLHVFMQILHHNPST